MINLLVGVEAGTEREEAIDRKVKIIITEIEVKAVEGIEWAGVIVEATKSPEITIITTCALITLCPIQIIKEIIFKINVKINLIPVQINLIWTLTRNRKKNLTKIREASILTRGQWKNQNRENLKR